MSGDATEDARSLVGGLAPDVSSVAVSAPERDLEAACARVLDLAVAAGEGRRVLLVNLAGRGLDRELGVEDAPGLADVVAGERSTADVIVRSEEISFLYLPAGDARGPSPETFRVAAKLARGMRDADGLLLLYLSEDALDEPILAEHLDGVVLLGEATAPAGEGGAPEAGRLSLTAMAAGTATEGPGPDGTTREGSSVEEATSEGTTPEGSPAKGATAETTTPDGTPEERGEGSDRWRRHRERHGFPVSRALLAALVIGGLAGGWWWLARSASGAGDGPGGAERPPVSGTSEGGTPGDDGRADGTPGDRTREEGREEALASRLEDAPALSHSVLVASFADRARALESLARWSRADDVAYFLAPARVRGGTYHRVFAGAFGERAAAEELMDELVRTGRMERRVGWHVRPVERAFRLGVFAEEEAAREARRRATEEGIPTYLVRARTDGETLYQLYAGAYESEEYAAPLAGALREAGRSPELVIRRGTEIVR